MEKQSKSNLDGILTEITASKIIGGRKDDFKNAYNEAMDKALRIVKRYKEGNGLFQIPNTSTLAPSGTAAEFLESKGISDNDYMETGTTAHIAELLEEYAATQIEKCPICEKEGCDCEEVFAKPFSLEGKNSGWVSVEEIAKLIPTSWIDPLLTGTNKALSGEAGKWGCEDIENLLNGIKIRILEYQNSPQTK